MPLRGGVGPLMANAIKNFHFDFLTTSLMQDSFFHTIVGVGMNRVWIGWALGRSNKVGQMVDMVYVSNIFPPRSFSAQTKQGG